MEIPSKYSPDQVENKWYQYWMEKGFFRSEPDEREPYTIVIPPPNVTGVLHMGHMLNNTLQDVLVRRARMQGKNACWVPGTDHASIATEAKVVGKLKSEGIDKNQLSREDFLKHAWEWTEKHGGIILEQLKKLGASCDWDRTNFTMNDDYYEDVISVFIDLYDKGKIYRGTRMVNWDPQAKTAVSDEEVVYKELQSKLYYVNYKIKDDDGFITIATTRPETILGDTAVCVNPNDERFSHLIGKKVIVPVVEREVPVIGDDYVDMEFGTGCLKITPSHDENDYEIGLKHNLEFINIFNDDGTLNDNGVHYEGKDRFEVRDLILEELEGKKDLSKVEDYTNKVGYSERTDAVIEPKLSRQWFVSMKELAQPALENVMNNNIQLVPEKFKNTYRHWMENVKDWCISRQLWWGHRIPIFYIKNSEEHVAAKNLEEALEKARRKTGDANLTAHDLKQDEDVVDTWFSSWLWPISVFNGIKEPENADIRYYYPTNDLVTAPEILFFWVARMIIAGYEYREEKPFRNVYLTGIVRDSQRRKMSKSLGNSPDPLDLIKKYSADGVRVGMLLSSPAGNDLLFDESLSEQGRNFGNKIWNAFRLVKSWDVKDADQPEYAVQAIKWFEQRLNQEIKHINELFDGYRISDALMAVYRLFWDDFSSWYLEAVKPAFQKPVDSATYQKTIGFFEELLKLLHPFMPFITEEIWHYITERDQSDCIMIARQNTGGEYDQNSIDQFELVKEITAGVRTIRNQKNIPNREQLTVKAFLDKNTKVEMSHVLEKLANLESFEFVSEKIEGALSFRVKANELYVPMDGIIDVDEEIRKIKEELKYQNGFLKSVLKKLGNERFVNNAPEAVVEKEKSKKTDAETKISLLEDRLKGFKSQ